MCWLVNGVAELVGVIIPLVFSIFQTFWRRESCSSRLFGVNDAPSDKELPFETLMDRS